ncbi:uncharacterized protein LOC143443409 isoform X2 [Arvicanthis niloticus]|uniref:uncharacterized protein LOC143434371 n=1 Tax=Arvicanthis niloticus TaxID=61156 RepID=UPI00402B65B7
MLSLSRRIKALLQKDPVCAASFLLAGGCAGHLVPKPGRSRPRHRQHLRGPLDSEEDSELQGGTFGEEDENPFWVPERLTRKIFEHEKPMLPKSTVDHHDEDVDKPEDGNRDTMVGDYDNLPNSHAGDQ